MRTLALIGVLAIGLIHEQDGLDLEYYENRCIDGVHSNDEASSITTCRFCFVVA